jgi:hypothetical protein
MPLMTAHEIEQQHARRFKEQQRERMLAKFSNPDADPDLERTWVVFSWHPAGEDVTVGEWKVAGFLPRKRRRKPQSMGRFFARVRRKLQIDKKTPVRVSDLGVARNSLSVDQTWLTQPPKYQKRKRKMEPRMPKPLGKTTKRRAKQKAFVLNKRVTKYIAIGRNAWDRAPGYLYLGPLSSMQKRQAQFEARRVFSLYNTLLVLETRELSKPLRNAMASSKRVRAGVTRIQWPEVPPTFEEQWAKFMRRLLTKELHGAIAPDDARLVDVELALHEKWKAQGSPWLTLGWFRKQTNAWRPACPAKRKRRKSKRAATTLTKSRNSARKHKRNSMTQRNMRKPKKSIPTNSTPKRSLRSMLLRLKSVVRSVNGTTTKMGSNRTSPGSSTERTSMQYVLVAHATTSKRARNGKASARSSKSASRSHSISKTSRRTKTSDSRKKSAQR